MTQEKSKGPQINCIYKSAMECHLTSKTVPVLTSSPKNILTQNNKSTFLGHCKPEQITVVCWRLSWKCLDPGIQELG